ncbi:MAG: ribonuclease III domain-containing protein [Pseudomonadota bacterium]
MVDAIDLILNDIENKLQYVFTNKYLLKDALERKSMKNINRLEFLGDSIINLIITNYIFTHHSGKDAGFLSQLRSYLVSNEIQIKICHDLDIAKYVVCNTYVGRDGFRAIDDIYRIQKDNSNVDHYTKLVANFLEVLIGAIYIDCKDLICVEKIIYNLWRKFFNSYNKSLFNVKSVLQEYCYNNNFLQPVYDVIATKHSDFRVQVKVGENIAFGIASTKKEGSKIAAKKMLEILKGKKFKKS